MKTNDDLRMNGETNEERGCVDLPAMLRHIAKLMSEGNDNWYADYIEYVRRAANFIETDDNNMTVDAVDRMMRAEGLVPCYEQDKRGTWKVRPEPEGLNFRSGYDFNPGLWLYVNIQNLNDPRYVGPRGAYISGAIMETERMLACLRSELDRVEGTPSGPSCRGSEPLGDFAEGFAQQIAHIGIRRVKEQDTKDFNTTKFNDAIWNRAWFILQSLVDKELDRPDGDEAEDMQ